MRQPMWAVRQLMWETNLGQPMWARLSSHLAVGSKSKNMTLATCSAPVLLQIL
ncbi:glutamate/gamma-aminobutyrate family transporter YjeM [Sesbania bispinosa]|nr:glutamate/gamma-aminobutyrate family transporter YjeM [Sesbania bispinosa]